MLRFLPSLPITRRYGARVVALLFAAHVALFAHAINHAYDLDGDQQHTLCGLCVAAQHLDDGLASAPFALPVAARVAATAPDATRIYYGPVRAAFEARAPPLQLPS